MGDTAQSHVSSWLEQLGLGQYAPAFAENGIEFDGLMRLSEQRLTEFGVQHQDRQALLSAIAGLQTKRTVRAALGQPRQRTAERRQITVMMCDVVGSTELSSRLDPEDLRTIIRLYQSTCSEVVARHDGLIAQYRGDGVMVFFGYPRAGEDDAERAVRCALDLKRAIAELDDCPEGKIGVRLGLATGIAVLGDLVGGGASEHFDATGQVPNLAARIETFAAPGAVTIADSTKRLIGDLFECVDLGTHRFKGIDQDVRVWQVVAERDLAVRFEGLHHGEAERLVAREREVAVLQDRWREAVAGRGQVVLLSGEPGIGKSRLVHHLTETLGGESFVPVRLQCSTRHAGSPLYPLIVHMKRAAGFERSDGPEIRLQKIETAFGRHGGPDAVRLMANLLSVPLIGRYPALAGPAERVKAQTLALMLEETAWLASHRPILLLIEDAHWMDPTTEELAMLLVDRLRELRLLAVVTARSEYQPAWAMYPHVSLLPLERLEQHEAGQLVRQITGSRVLPAALVEEILDKTDGVPLFIEELTKSVLEASPDPNQPIHVFNGAVPDTLQDSLMARLDRLGPIKRIAQVGAAIGRRFSFGTLSEVVKQDPDELAEALGRLVASELVYQRGTPPQAQYIFKHALVQDIAYGSLLRADRKAIHAEIAQVLETRSPELMETEPEALAHHWACADAPGKAARYGLRAAQRSIARSANEEAIRHLKSALALLERIPEAEGRPLLAFNLHLAYGQASYVVNGPAHVETVNAFMHAQQLVEAVRDAGQRYALLYGIFASYHFASRFDLAEQPARRAFALASREADAGHMCLGHRMLGYLSFFRGDLNRAVEHFHAVQTLYVPELHGRLAAMHGCDSRGGTAGFWVVADAVCGWPDTALRRTEANIDWSRELGHSGTLGWALTASCYLHFFMLDPEAALPATIAGRDYCEQHNVGTWAVHCRVFNSWARAHVEDPARCADEIRSAIADAGSRIALGVPLFHSVLADALIVAGQIPEAIAAADEALRQAKDLNQAFFEATIHEIRGRSFLRAAQPDIAEAAASFRRSAAAAKRMGARLLELRAATRLAALGGEHAEIGRDMIARLYPLFTEGFYRPELVDARACLRDS